MSEYRPQKTIILGDQYVSEHKLDLTLLQGEFTRRVDGLNYQAEITSAVPRREESPMAYTLNVRLRTEENPSTNKELIPRILADITARFGKPAPSIDDITFEGKAPLLN